MHPRRDPGQGEASPPVGHRSPLGPENAHAGPGQRLLGGPVEDLPPDLAKSLAVGGQGEKEGGGQSRHGSGEGPPGWQSTALDNMILLDQDAFI